MQIGLTWRTRSDGLTTFRKGHYWMFWIGFFLPILWIIGALIGPTEAATARAAGAA